jgi:hypothetical protein
MRLLRFGGRKADQDAIVKGRRFVFRLHLALTLQFLILTAYCYYRGKKDAQILGAFFAVFYALCALILGIRIYMDRRSFFSKAKDLDVIRRVIRP